MIDREIEQECAKKPYSGSRSLIRVKRSINMLKVMFEEMLSSGYVHTSFLQFIDEFETFLHGLRNGV